MAEDQLGVFVGIPPIRVLDTRPTGGGAVTTGFNQNGVAISPGQFGSPDRRDYRIGGQFGIPADVRGIVGNVTLVQSGPSGGFVTIQAGGSTGTPTTASLNPVGAITGNFFTINTASGGAPAGQNISVIAVGVARDIIIDVTGYYY